MPRLDNDRANLGVPRDIIAGGCRDPTRKRRSIEHRPEGPLEPIRSHWRQLPDRLTRSGVDDMTVGATIDHELLK